MVIEQDQILQQGLNTLTVAEFVKMYHPHLSLEAVRHAAHRGTIDYTKPSRDMFIVLTGKTLEWESKVYETKNR